MKKFKHLLLSLGLGALLLFGAATVSAASMGELEGTMLSETSEDVILEDHDAPAGGVLSSPAPNSFKYSSSLTSVSMDWDSVNGANGYRIYIGPHKATTGFKLLGIKSSSKCTIERLHPGTPYTIRIQAVKIQKVNGVNKIVDKAAKYLRADILTQIPSVNRVTSDRKGKFTIRMFNPAPSNKADDIVGYKVSFTNLQKGSTSTKAFNSRTGFSYRPRANTFYKLTIRPYITVNGKKKESKQTITHYIAQQPKLSRKVSNDRQIISWKRVAGSNYYNVYVKYPGSNSYKLVKRTTGLSHTLTDLKKGQSYRVKVVAYKGKFPSASSTYYTIKA